jgi:predicted small integral membrane protein
MVTRTAKIMLLAAIAFNYTLVVFNNLTDFNSNYQFVCHVLSMDSTFPSNQGMWRALTQPALQLVFYLGIIAWESLTCLLLWWGVWSLVRVIKQPAHLFNAAKRVPVIGLTLSLLMWLVAFLSVGAEWFLMWQSHTWNGQEAAFRNFAIVGIILLIQLQPETESQP